MEVINLFSAPGGGKSTTAAMLFALMKLKQINCELVNEFCKQLVWQERHKTFDDQIYLFAKQHHKLFNLKGKVDYVITDSPILLSLVYQSRGFFPSFAPLVKEANNSFDNLNFLIKRVKPYNPVGRNQDEQGSNEIGREIEKMLKENNVSYTEIDGNEQAAPKIIEHLKL